MERGAAIYTAVKIEKANREKSWLGKKTISALQNIQARPDHLLSGCLPTWIMLVCLLLSNKSEGEMFGYTTMDEIRVEAISPIRRRDKIFLFFLAPNGCWEKFRSNAGLALVNPSSQVAELRPLERKPNRWKRLNAIFVKSWKLKN